MTNKLTQRWRARRSGPPRERNPILVGTIGIVAIAVLALGAFLVDSLPIIGAGPKYHAEFSEAAGLRPDSEVRVAGVKVGVVTDVELAGDRVKVTFRAKGVDLNDQTRASIQIKTVLGQKYLQLDPAGAGPLGRGGTIPLDRTTSPYDVVVAFSQASDTLGDIDSDQLATSMSTLAEVFDGSAQHVQPALDGLTRLSDALNSRDEDLRRLVSATRETSEIVANRNGEFQRLIRDAGALLQELGNRREAISNLLTGTKDLSATLSGIVADNREQLGPTLDNLNHTLGILSANKDQIDRSVELLGPFYRLYAKILGTGRWMDITIVNLMPLPIPNIPDTREPARDLGQGG